MSGTLALTRELISLRSITPDDAGCQELIAARLQTLGCRVERLRYGLVDNLWAVLGQGQPTLCFAGHTDVVPAGPLSAWESDPFQPQIRDGRWRRAGRDRGVVAWYVVVQQLEGV